MVLLAAAFPVLAMAALLLQEAPVTPSPPPDRYDPAHDKLLGEAWGSPSGPVDPDLETQPPPLRPGDWVVVEAPGRPGSELEALFRRLVVHRFERSRGEASWRPVRLPEEGELSGAFLAARTHVEVPEDTICFVRAPGVETVFVNGDGFVGDPRRHGGPGVPVALRAGRNEILAVGVQGGFELELWKPMTRLVMGTWSCSVSRQGTMWDEVAIPVFNASTRSALGVHFHYGRPRVARTEMPSLSDWCCYRYAAPLAAVMERSLLFEDDRASRTWTAPTALVPFCAYVNGDAHADRRLVEVPMELQDPRPHYSADLDSDLPTWPVPGRYTLPVLIYETSPSAIAYEALAVARWCQQRIMERKGWVCVLGSATWLAGKQGRSETKGAPLVRFGFLEGEPPGVLIAERTTGDGGRVEASLRASDPAAMRLVYLLDPFFRDIEDDVARFEAP